MRNPAFDHPAALPRMSEELYLLHHHLRKMDRSRHLAVKRKPAFDCPGILQGRVMAY